MENIEEILKDLKKDKDLYDEEVKRLSELKQKHLEATYWSISKLILTKFPDSITKVEDDPYDYAKFVYINKDISNNEEFNNFIIRLTLEDLLSNICILVDENE